MHAGGNAVKKKKLVVFGLVILVGGGFFKLSGLYDAMYSPKIMVKSAPQKIDTPVRLVGWSWYSSGCRFDSTGWNAMISALWDPVADARRAIVIGDFRLAKILGPYSSRRHLETSNFGNITCTRIVPAVKAPGWNNSSFATDLIDQCTFFQSMVQECYVNIYNWEIFHHPNYPYDKYCNFKYYCSAKDTIEKCINTSYVERKKKIIDSVSRFKSCKM